MNTLIETVAVIPAYNEVSTVSEVMTAAGQSEHIDALVVVDDGSTDGTYRTALNAQQQLDEKPSIVVRHECNIGKTEALLTGVQKARTLGGASLTTLVFVDADLSPISTRSGTNRKMTQRALDVFRQPDKTMGVDDMNFPVLLASYLDELVGPVKSGEQVMSIGMPERNKLTDLMRLWLDWGALAGTRAVSLAMWESMFEDCTRKDIQPHGWEIEAALNTYTRLRRNEDGVKLNKFIGKTLMEGVVNVGSRVKAGGFMPGIRRMSQVHMTSSRAFVKYARIF